MAVRVLIADDHEVIRQGLVALLNGTEVEVLGAAANGAELVQMVRANKPEVVLVDIRMPETDGLTALGQLKTEFPDLPVVMLSTYDNPTYISQAANLGASGYVLKGCSRQELISAVQNAATGRTAWTNEDARRSRVDGATPSDLEVPLTKREIEVLCQVASGLGNKEIARTLHISVETVKEHVHNILGKLNASGRTQAAVWAVRQGLA